jgi:predicted Zn-dependent protease
MTAGGESVSNLLSSTDTEIRHAFMGAAWWTLLHELGHLSLNHLDAEDVGSRPSIGGELVVEQRLSDRQRQELEADRYAVASLTPTGLQLAYGWANFALGPTMMMETLAAVEGFSHPLSVNRLNNARTLTAAVDAVAGELRSEEHLRRHGKAHVNIRRQHAVIRAAGQQTFFAGWSRDDFFDALDSLAAAIPEAKPAFERLRASTGFGWRRMVSSVAGP